MSYQWNKIIESEEVVQKEFTISSLYRIIIFIITSISSVIVGFVAWYVGIIVFLLGVLYWYYLKVGKHYAFTSKRIILVESFIGSSIISIDYNQITDIEIEQSMFDQLGGWGTLIINTAGTHVPIVNLPFLDNVQSIKQQLDTIRDSKKTT